MGTHPRKAASPLELLHPRGFAQSAVVVGDGCPPSLRPHAQPPAAGAGAELVVAGFRARASDVTRVTSDETIVYVLGRRGQNVLRRDLRALGFRSAGTFLHLPSFEQSSRLVAVGGWAERRVLAQRGGLARLPFAGRMVRRLKDSGAVLCKPGVTPLAWLPSASPGSLRRLQEIVIHSSTHGEVTTSVVRAGDVVAKVGDGPSVSPPGVGEAAALRDIAAHAGVAAPRLLGELDLDGVPVVVETVVPGIPAATRIARDPTAALPLLEQLVGWLGDWNAATAADRALTADVLQSEVFGPAAELSGEYPAALAARWNPLEGSRAAAVAVHQDLTMVNVLLGGNDLAVIDWASARGDGLPLTDFFYAALDTRAAVDGYRDRAGAFAACFSPGGDWFEVVRDFELELRDRLDVDSAFADLAFHATWLHHAANEVRRGEQSSEFRELERRARTIR